MTDPAIGPYPAAYRVRFDEAGSDGSARASTLLRYAQDVAWRHSEALGYPRAWYAERGLAWLVRAVELEVAGRAAAGEELAVATKVVGFRAAWARRRTTAEQAGKPIAMLLTDWVLVDPTGRPTRVPAELTARFGGTGASFRPTRLPRLHPPTGTAASRLRVRLHELDPMGHVNHAVYVDHFDDAVEAAGGGAEAAVVPRRYGLEFLVAAEAGDRLVGSAWRDGSGWSYVLTGPGGATCFRALVRPGAADATGSR